MLQERVIDKIGAGQPLAEDAISDCIQYLKDCALNGKFVSDLLREVESVYKKIPEERRDFFRGHLLFQTRVHLPYIKMLDNYCKSLLAYQSKEPLKAIEFAEKALYANNAINAVFFDAEYGKWQNWFIGSSLPWNNYTHDEIRVLIAKLKGEPDPPVRPLRYDPEFYNYQVPFAKNYPLLYPKK